jgi:hypothetical protein
MRMSGNEVNAAGELVSGYDYEHQSWVEEGRYLDCGHPQSMRCGCYGRRFAGLTAQEIAMLSSVEQKEMALGVGCAAPFEISGYDVDATPEALAERDAVEAQFDFAELMDEEHTAATTPTTTLGDVLKQGKCWDALPVSTRTLITHACPYSVIQAQPGWFALLAWKELTPNTRKALLALDWQKIHQEGGR